MVQMEQLIEERFPPDPPGQSGLSRPALVCSGSKEGTWFVGVGASSAPVPSDMGHRSEMELNQQLLKMSNCRRRRWTSTEIQMK